MIEIIKPTITKEVDANGQYGKFVIEPLERGYGTTLGNSLRRIAKRIAIINVVARLRIPIARVFLISSKKFASANKNLNFSIPIHLEWRSPVFGL